MLFSHSNPPPGSLNSSASASLPSSSSSYDSSSASSSRPHTPSTPRRAGAGTAGGFVPMSSAKLLALQREQQRTGGQGVRPLSTASSAGSNSDGSLGGGGGHQHDVLAELNGVSSIRRVGGGAGGSGPSAAVKGSAASSQLPLTSASSSSSRAPSTCSTPSATSTLRGPPPSSMPRLARPTPSSLATPSAAGPFQRSRTPQPPPPQPPAISVVSPSKTSAEAGPAEAEPAALSLFPKIKAKLTDGSRPRKKGLPSPAHVVTPHKLGAFRPPGAADEAFLSADAIREFDGGKEDEDWSIVKDQDDAFWDDGPGAPGEKENVKVSIRIRPLNPLSMADYSIWEASGNQLKLAEGAGRRGAKDDWTFDHVVAGSDNREIYEVAAQGHVRAAMEGFNSVVFAYGQTASGKTFTLTGSESEPGIIPRAIEDVFAFIRRHSGKEFLLRASYLEIYNEVIKDLLAPATRSVEIRGAGGNDVTLHPVREEVVTNPAHVREILARGEVNRRTAATDWNERSSRSHSVFRLVIESRDKVVGGEAAAWSTDESALGRTPNGKRKGKATRTSTLSLIDLAGSEKATSDKLRSAEGKFINTSLLALKQVVSTIAKNELKKENAHVSYRNSKLTRMLQPSLSGDSKVSVICTMNPSAQAISETNSTLNFATGLKAVRLTATRKEVVEDPHALIQQYQTEIASLRAQLQEKEVPKDSSRRLSRREEQNLTQYRDRIRDLSSLILTSQRIDEEEDAQARPVSPTKVDFDASLPDLQRELFAARVKIDEQAVEMERLEEELKTRPPLPPGATESDKDKLIGQLQAQVNLYRMINDGYEANLGAPMRKVAEDVEKEWQPKVDEWRRKEEEARLFAVEISRKLEKEMAAHKKLQALHDRLISLAQETQLSASHNGASPTRHDPHLAPGGGLGPTSPGSMYDLDRLAASASRTHDDDDLLATSLGDRITRGEASSWDLNEQLRRLS